jgi:hypothetical protein
MIAQFARARAAGAGRWLHKSHASYYNLHNLALFTTWTAQQPGKGSFAHAPG